MSANSCGSRNRQISAINMHRQVLSRRLVNK